MHVSESLIIANDVAKIGISDANADNIANPASDALLFSAPGLFLGNNRLFEDVLGRIENIDRNMRFDLSDI